MSRPSDAEPPEPPVTQRTMAYGFRVSGGALGAEYDVAMRITTLSDVIAATPIPPVLLDSTDLKPADMDGLREGADPKLLGEWESEGGAAPGASPYRIGGADGT